MSWRIGIDLGGTKIECILLDPDGTEKWRKRVPTPHGDYEGTLEAIRSLYIEGSDSMRVCEPGAGPCTIGVGTPGSESPITNLHRNANSTCLNGRDLAGDLARIIGQEVRLANDANCFALSEATDGAGAGARVVFGVILGTGCGGGVVVDGKIVVGPSRVAGEWGHTALPRRDGKAWEPRACYCGRNDCLEQYISGSAIEAEYEDETGQRMSVAAIAAVAGDGQAKIVLQRFKHRLFAALAGVVDIIDPDVIVLGGGVSNLSGLAEDIEQHLSEHVFGNESAAKIRKAKYGDSSGVRGAAWL